VRRCAQPRAERATTPSEVEADDHLADDDDEDDEPLPAPELELKARRATMPWSRGDDRADDAVGLAAARWRPLLRAAARP